MTDAGVQSWQVMLDAIDWDDWFIPAESSPTKLRNSVLLLAKAKSKAEASEAAHRVRRDAGNDHGGVMYSVAVPLVDVLSNLAQQTEGEPRRAALNVLADWMGFTAYPSIQVHPGSDASIAIAEEVWHRISLAEPFLRSVAADQSDVASEEADDIIVCLGEGEGPANAGFDPIEVIRRLAEEGVAQFLQQWPGSSMAPSPNGKIVGVHIERC
ncbi:hypothetical protein Cs7R123_56880 [Catellatospora sp. TT07R-123]|uniref:hypothetical protein n=1 Tax=Catellatospora sp. TT07R-123 TaxID=2733863 RepID=UPI001B23E9C9|nr:hypothetical protein [Catellatospora sp. TT07R-123]GHJ48346.1 hypothetical protein Cs7R123_56880 [Catellatospora sp. TT07R-123]